MTTIPYNPAEVSTLRKEAGLYGILLDREQADSLLHKVCDHGGNRGVCVDALRQSPRPTWVEEIAGPIVVPSK